MKKYVVNGKRERSDWPRMCITIYEQQNPEYEPSLQYPEDLSVSLPHVALIHIICVILIRIGFPWTNIHQLLYENILQNQFIETICTKSVCKSTVLYTVRTESIQSMALVFSSLKVLLFIKNRQ